MAAAARNARQPSETVLASLEIGQKGSAVNQRMDALLLRLMNRGPGCGSQKAAVYGNGVLGTRYAGVSLESKALRMATASSSLSTGFSRNLRMPMALALSSEIISL